MKRTLIAALFATFATTVLAASSQYSNQAGEQDLHTPIASSDQYRNEAGEQDAHTSIAKSDEYRNDAGERDQHQPQVADAGDNSRNQEQNSPQLG